jgi:predicted metal-dependent HD superfamily phosphohydrolase
MDIDRTTRLLNRTQFRAEWGAIGAQHSAAAFDALCTDYAQPHRAYHTGEHIAECLAWFDGCGVMASHPPELSIAIYFHDAVYEPTAHDNEARSAELFRKLARDAGVATDALARVAALIESTATHDAPSGDAALLADIDLSVLGAPPNRYARFERDVRREYAVFDDGAYRMGRTRVLDSFLERPEIYRTSTFAAKFEHQARTNLSSALEALQQQPKGDVDV